MSAQPDLVCETHDTTNILKIRTNVLSRSLSALPCKVVVNSKSASVAYTACCMFSRMGSVRNTIYCVAMIYTHKIMRRRDKFKGGFAGGITSRIDAFLLRQSLPTSQWLLPGESELCHTLTTMFTVNDDLDKTRQPPGNTESSSNRCDSKEDDHCAVV